MWSSHGYLKQKTISNPTMLFPAKEKTPNSKRQAISDTCKVSGDLLRDALLQLRNNMIL